MYKLLIGYKDINNEVLVYRENFVGDDKIVYEVEKICGYVKDKGRGIKIYVMRWDNEKNR